MKKLLLDSASFDEVDLLTKTDAIAGVTTNPSLVAKYAKDSGLTYFVYLKKLADILLKNSSGFPHLSVEVLETDASKIYEEAVSLNRSFQEYFGDELGLFIKIPVTVQNLALITDLENNKVRVNATACMNASQAKLASDAGASIVSFFYNRMLDHEKDVSNVRHEMGYDGDPGVEIPTFSNLNENNTLVICGSIRKKQDVIRCWELGSDYVTASAKVIEDMMTHPQTDKVLKQFEEDAKKCQ